MSSTTIGFDRSIVKEDDIDEEKSTSYITAIPAARPSGCRELWARYEKCQSNTIACSTELPMACFHQKVLMLRQKKQGQRSNQMPGWKDGSAHGIESR